MHLRTLLLALLTVPGFAAIHHAHGALVIIEDFETGEGRFNLAPSFSGTTTGETETQAGVGPSTADHDLTLAISGLGSQRIFMDDSEAADVPLTNPVQAWRLRHLSGGGTPANNLSLAATGFIGYYLRTSTSDLMASIMIDDGTALERAAFLPINPDGEWHLYQWNFADAEQWEAFAGTGANGEINSPTVTIDALFIVANKTSGKQDAVFHLDYVAANTEGPIAPIPEPGTASLAGLGLAAWAWRRQRGPGV